MISLLVTQANEGVHMSAVTKDDKPVKQHSHAENNPVPQSHLQSLYCMSIRIGFLTLRLMCCLLNGMWHMQ